MNYLVVNNIAYEGASLYEFDSIDKAFEYLSKNILSYDDNDFELYEISQKLDVMSLVKSYDDSIVERKKEALNKLTESDKIILGLA